MPTAQKVTGFIISAETYNDLNIFLTNCVPNWMTWGQISTLFRKLERLQPILEEVEIKEETEEVKEESKEEPKEEPIVNKAENFWE